MTLLQSILIAIVEGITEFLPVSSTGHMIIAQKILMIPSTDFVKDFTVNIQFGASFVKYRFVQVSIRSAISSSSSVTFPMMYCFTGPSIGKSSGTALT